MSSGMSISMCSGFGASPPDWVVGVGLLVLVFGECTGIPGYLAQDPQTILGHLGQL